jgi:hypothetical protein
MAASNLTSDLSLKADIDGCGGMAKCQSRHRVAYGLVHGRLSFFYFCFAGRILTAKATSWIIDTTRICWQSQTSL